MDSHHANKMTELNDKFAVLLIVMYYHPEQISTTQTQYTDTQTL